MPLPNRALLLRRWLDAHPTEDDHQRRSLALPERVDRRRREVRLVARRGRVDDAHRRRPARPAALGNRFEECAATHRPRGAFGQVEVGLEVSGEGLHASSSCLVTMSSSRSSSPASPRSSSAARMRRRAQQPLPGAAARAHGARQAPPRHPLRVRRTGADGQHVPERQACGRRTATRRHRRSRGVSSRRWRRRRAMQLYRTTSTTNICQSADASRVMIATFSHRAASSRRQRSRSTRFRPSASASR